MGQYLKNYEIDSTAQYFLSDNSFICTDLSNIGRFWFTKSRWGIRLKEFILRPWTVAEPHLFHPHFLPSHFPSIDVFPPRPLL